LDVEDIPPETLRARRRTRASHRTTQTPHPAAPAITTPPTDATTIVARPGITIAHPFPDQPTVVRTDVTRPTAPIIVVTSPEAQATSTSTGASRTLQMHPIGTRTDMAVTSSTGVATEAATVPSNDAPLEAISAAASRASIAAERARVGLSSQPRQHASMRSDTAPTAGTGESDTAGIIAQGVIAPEKGVITTEKKGGDDAVRQGAVDTAKRVATAPKEPRRLPPRKPISQALSGESPCQRQIRQEASRRPPSHLGPPSHRVRLSKKIPFASNRCSELGAWGKSWAYT